MSERVKLAVDQELCVGVGQCELLEPQVFRLDDETGLADVVDEATLDQARADIVVDRCPSGAITTIVLG